MRQRNLRKGNDCAEHGVGVMDQWHDLQVKKLGLAARDVTFDIREQDCAPFDLRLLDWQAEFDGTIENFQVLERTTDIPESGTEERARAGINQHELALSIYHQLGARGGIHGCFANADLEHELILGFEVAALCDLKQAVAQTAVGDFGKDPLLEVQRGKEV